jgi:hypothetical protein
MGIDFFFFVCYSILITIKKSSIQWGLIYVLATSSGLNYTKLNTQEMKKDLNQFELRHDSTSEGSSWPLISH